MWCPRATPRSSPPPTRMRASRPSTPDTNSSICWSTWSPKSADSWRASRLLRRGRRVGAALWKAKIYGDGRTAGAFCTGGAVAMGKDIARLSILSAFLPMRFTLIGGVDDQGFGTLGPEATTGPADPGLSEKELDEGRRFGERFARMTRQIRAARQ